MNRYRLLYALLCILSTQLQCASHDLQSLVAQNTRETPEQKMRRKALIRRASSKNSCCLPTQQNRNITRELYYYNEAQWDGNEAQCSVKNYIRMRRAGWSWSNVFACTSMSALIPWMTMISKTFDSDSPYIATSLIYPVLCAACFYPCAYHDEDVSNPNNWENGKYKPTQITMPEKTI